jgi:hypothetical protein
MQTMLQSNAQSNAQILEAIKAIAQPKPQDVAIAWTPIIQGVVKGGGWLNCFN